MKKLFVCFLFSLATLSAKSQLTHLHDFSGMIFHLVNYWNEDNNVYYHTDSTTCYIYDWDFSLIKTVNLVAPNGYKYSSLGGLSRNCFNTDNKWEMFVLYSRNDNSNRDSMYIARIINEDGNIIHDFGAAGWFNFGNCYKHNNELRCSMVIENYNSSNTIVYTTKIYRCAGNGGSSQSVNQAQNKNKSVAYPNPARNIITLSYNLPSGNTSEIRIFNAAGQLVKNIPVGPHFNEVQVDVSSFPHGTYIYECEGVTNKFIVQ